MAYKIGFIGGGNMASAIIKGLISTGVYHPDEILVSVLRKESLSRVKNTLAVEASLDNKTIVSQCEIVVLAVKPQYIEPVLKEIQPFLKADQLLISIAAGVTLKEIEKLSNGASCYRAMPNTPAAVNMGMTSICTSLPLDTKSTETVQQIFNAIGKTAIINESQMHAAIAVHGSSPAYVYMMIEAMADAGVLLGLPRQQSYEMAAQTLLGAASMVLESGKHPGELKDQVTSPGGTTIEALASLEKTGFRSSLIQAMISAAEKSKDMSS